MKQRLKSKTYVYCCLLLAAIALVGCGTKSNVPNTSTPLDNQVSQSESASSESNAAVNTDYDSQLQLIADNATVWMGDTELTAEPYFYAVTDFDQNGRLEIVQSSCQGTGLYTYTQIWEVNEATTELVPCQFSSPEGDSQPDIITDPDEVYFDEANDRYFYIFSDDIRNGAAEHYRSWIAFSLQDGVVETSLLAQSHSIYSSDSSVVTTYTDAAGNDIDEDAYNAAAENAFANLTPMKAVIGWTDYTVSEQLSGLTNTEIKDVLENSWKGFSLT